MSRVMLNGNGSCPVVSSVGHVRIWTRVRITMCPLKLATGHKRHLCWTKPFTQGSKVVLKVMIIIPCIHVLGCLGIIGIFGPKVFPCNQVLLFLFSSVPTPPPFFSFQQKSQITSSVILSNVTSPNNLLLNSYVESLNYIFYMFLTCMLIFMLIGCNLPFDL